MKRCSCLWILKNLVTSGSASHAEPPRPRSGICMRFAGSLRSDVGTRRLKHEEVLVPLDLEELGHLGFCVPCGAATSAQWDLHALCWVPQIGRWHPTLEA